MGWGATLTGYSGVTATLDELEERWGGSVTWVVGTNVEYAVYQEFGTSRHQAQPFLRPAVKQVMREADAIADRASSTGDLVRMLALEIERRAKHLAPVDTGRLRASLEAKRIS